MTIYTIPGLIYSDAGTESRGAEGKRREGEMEKESMGDREIERGGNKKMLP